MLLNITNDLNYMFQKTEGNPEDKKRYDEYVNKINKKNK